MQGVLTFLATGAAALLQVPMILGAFQPDPGMNCLMIGLDSPRAPTLEQRLSDAGVPELSEAFGMEVAETPDVLRRGFHSEPPQRHPVTG